VTWLLAIEKRRKYSMRKLLFLIVIGFVFALALSACGGGSDTEEADEPAGEGLVGDAGAGQDYFEGTCSACHGMDAKGLPGLGKDLTTSEFVKGQSDTELVEFVKVGRPASDPANTTGVDMLPKGGNPALTEQQLYDIVAYVRTLEE
jgi:mono/diheme cytochrome c family protein